jgi:hypothetical protein
MADGFELLRFSKTEIVVKHPAEGHLFVFPIAQTASGRRVIGDGSCRNGPTSKGSAQFLHIRARLRARRFAETEARELDLIG